MPNTYGNRIKVSTSTTGTGTITLGSAVEGFQTFSSGGITDGNTVAYVIEDGANFEIGTGTYTASGTTLTRTVSESTNSNNAISLSGDAVVFVAPSASDLPFTDGASFSGAVTFAEDVTFDGATAGRDIVFDRSDDALLFKDNSRLKLGDLGDLQLYHDGSHSYLFDAGSGDLRIAGNNVNILNGGLGSMAKFINGGAVELYHNTSKKIETTSGGVEVTGTVTDDGAVHDGDVTFTGASYSAVWDKSDNALEFASGATATFGGSLTINATNLTYNQSGSGNFQIISNKEVDMKVSNSDRITLRATGAVDIYYSGSKKFATTSSGVDVTGNITVSGTVDGRDVATDGTKLDGIEASADVTDATNVASAGAAMTTGATFTGDVTFDGDAGNIVFDKSHDSLSFFQAAALKFVSTTATSQQSRIQWDGTRTHWETFNSTRVDLDGDFRLVGASYNVEWDKSANALEFADNAKATFGTGSDLQISHGGVFSNIVDSSNALYLQSAAIRFANAGGTEIFATMDSTSGVKLNFGGSTKIQTTSSGVTITGGTTSGDFTFTGASYNVVWDSSDNALEFAQNARVRFGNSNDFQLFSNGTTGILGITNTETLQFWNLSNSSVMAKFSPDGSNELYHNNSKKFETTSTGIQTTGTVNVNGAYSLPTSDGSANQVLSTDGSGNLSFADAGGNSSNVAGGSYIGGSYAGANLVASSGNYNTLLGQYAGNDVTTGDANVAVGYASLELVTTASSSTAIGAYAARYNTGADNVALGADALTGSSGSSSGTLNVAIGRQAGRYVTTGFKNILIGGYAGNSIQTGHSNILIGNDSGRYSTGGFNAVAIGIQAGGGENVSGGFSNSVAVGNQSGGNSTGGRNSYLGYYAGRYRTSGSDNTAIGNRSQLGVSGQTTMVSALPNTSVGSESLYGITTGLSNVAMGYRAGRSISSGGNNVLIGNDAGYSLTTHNNNIAIGTNAAKYTTNISNISIGYNSMGGYSSTGDNNYRNLIIGHEAARSHDTGENTFIGYQAGYRRVTGTQHTAIGYQSQYGSAENNTYNANTSVGHSTLYNISTGKNNVAMGYKALYDNTTGNQNLAIGNSAGENITSGFENIAIGHETFYTATGAYRNTAVGYQALYTTTTNENAAFGWQALREASSGSANTAVGAHALSTVSTGYYNTALGKSAGDNITTGYNNIVIGYNASASAVSVNNEVTIGDSNITRFRVPGAGIDNTSAALSGTTPSIDVSARDTYTLTTSGNTTFTFTNVPSGPQVAKFTLILTAGGTHTLTWPTSVDWAGGSAPSAPASGEKNIYTFMSIDGGTNWYGFLAGAAFA